MEVPARTLERSDKEDKLDKGSVRLRVHLVLLFISIVVIKGLLITTLHFLLKVNVKQSVDLNPHPIRISDESTDEEELQLHAEELQRVTAFLRITTDSGFQLCPKKWHRFRGQCYFISAGLEEDRKWAESVKYCAEHNGSLGIIQHEAEMEFLISQLNMFSETPFVWLGLTDAQAEGVWAWLDGTLVQNQMFIKVQWDAEHRDCADLRGDRSVFASDCESYGPWLCEKPINLPEI